MVDIFFFLLALLGSIVVVFWIGIASVLCLIGWGIARMVMREVEDKYLDRKLWPKDPRAGDDG